MSEKNIRDISLCGRGEEREREREGEREGKEKGKERGRDFSTQEFMQSYWDFFSFLLKSEHEHKAHINFSQTSRNKA